ncbi:hypothetical protein EMPS_05923 [Entomortierella parvispora]|uniref:Uncharacterized protein n=1 Tax=Entomortierella parvispora TaxID=205924 RepID=A0A9P3HBN2_9FUNG|nr:hypothetical protein EMPS_05923 [Entomortierella parvispora]
MSSSRAFVLAARAGSRLASPSSPAVFRTPLSLSWASSLHQRSLHASATSIPRSVRPFHPASNTVARRGYSSAGSDPSMSPLGRSLITTVRIVQNVVVGSSTVFALGFFIWAGSHAYLESYKCPSPEGTSNTVQNCLHGAWVREEISPDPDVAEIYYEKALELTRQELERAFAASVSKDEGQQQSQHSKEEEERNRLLRMEKDKALTGIQDRLARFYARIGRDEQAATIWTRLWKLSDKKVIEQEAPSSMISSLFGSSKERTLMTQEDGLLYAKAAADCWMRLGEYELAEEALAWTLSTFTAIKKNSTEAASSPSSSSSSSSSSTLAAEEVGLLSTLGALYVRQHRFEYALSLFVKALQSTQEHRLPVGSDSTPKVVSKEEKQERDMWYCREAILMNSIGETLYGAATTSAATTTPASTVDSSSTASDSADQEKKSSSWKFWSSSSSSSDTNRSAKAAPTLSVEQQKKVEEALGWIQKAIVMAKEKSGQHRDCDECAALGLSTLGLIHEMEGKNDLALEEFKGALVHATKADDYVGMEDYNRNLTRLTDQMAAATAPIAQI